MVCLSRDFVCLPLFPSFVKIQISRYFFSRCKCTCCSSDAVTKASEPNIEMLVKVN